MELNIWFPNQDSVMQANTILFVDNTWFSSGILLHTLLAFVQRPRKEKLVFSDRSAILVASEQSQSDLGIEALFTCRLLASMASLTISITLSVGTLTVNSTAQAIKIVVEAAVATSGFEIMGSACLFSTTA